MHQPADGALGHRQAVELLARHIGRFVAQHDLSAAQVDLGSSNAAVVSRVFCTFDLPWNIGRLLVSVALPCRPLGAFVIR